MATYIALKGLPIEILAADPTNPVEGQIWFNSTSETLKGYNGSSNVTLSST